ncbi:uncharacterized protein BCR38DRAFT_521202 [Pseudomassariella vexata]|uniref:Tat pathway signal sequence n=1 Tax=Pseudomassariella vexata TaxID=1141098 RepID=A0A1Y2EHZ3_9PEZI|nr:uncharacterized protein BCR38DRAFT_521202 [Pseudomassariella vexata]ORY70415.1 hypothetical protein BCR38DRAFT_521202 [Pseudomassariella vexata]
MAPSFGSSTVSKEEIEDTVGLLSKDHPSSEDGSPLPTWREVPNKFNTSLSKTRFLLAGVVTLSLTNIATFLLLVVLATRQQACPLAVNHPPTGVAHAVEKLAGPPKPQLLNVTFYDHDQSIFRKHASDVADAFWYEYTQVDSGVILIPEEDAEQAAIDKSRHAYFDSPEMGLVGYPVKVEAIHQMHCLNLLRMNLYYNIDHTRETCGPPHCAGPEKYVQLHIDHCVEVLRLRLQCTADVGVTPLLWLGQEGRLTGDMARVHTCSDYEAVRKFVAEETTKLPNPGVIVPKNGEFYVDDYI